jgi:cytochrome c biogenesis protein CcmG, thiol:disulfide interchange protein DsbE
MKITSFLMLFCFAVVSANAQSVVPETYVKTLEGQQVNIRDLISKNKVTVLSFWATWCSPCKKELEAINEDYADWKNKYGVELVAITIDDTRALAKVSPMVKERGWSYTVLSDVNKDLMRALNFQAVPQTFVVDKDGKILYKHSTYVPGDEEELEKAIEKASKG